jgi:hypothetical protein
MTQGAFTTASHVATSRLVLIVAWCADATLRSWRDAEVRLGDSGPLLAGTAGRRTRAKTRGGGHRRRVISSGLFAPGEGASCGIGRGAGGCMVGRG